VVVSLYGSLGVLLLGAALRRRKYGPAVPALRLRAATAGTLLVVSPALLASPCNNSVGPAPVSGLGTHTEDVLFYATDHLGSTILTVRADGTRRNRFIYMPYGDPGVAQDGTPLRHRFAGEEVMAETGFYVLGARVYDPELGRFLQPDPLVGSPSDPQSFNRYTYARNNPLSWVDPSGLDPLPAPNPGSDCGDGRPCSPGPDPNQTGTYGPGPNDPGYYPDWGGQGPDWSNIGHAPRQPAGLPSAPNEATHVPQASIHAPESMTRAGVLTYIGEYGPIEGIQQSLLGAAHQMRGQAEYIDQLILDSTGELGNVEYRDELLQGAQFRESLANLSLTEDVIVPLLGGAALGKGTLSVARMPATRSAFYLFNNNFALGFAAGQGMKRGSGPVGFGPAARAGYELGWVAGLSQSQLAESLPR
jgi:RHS repeat-associated protein